MEKMTTKVFVPEDTHLNVSLAEKSYVVEIHWYNYNNILRTYIT